MIIKKIESLMSETNLDDKIFNEIALEVFEHQYKNNPIYQRIAKQSKKPSHWQEIPLLNIDIFKKAEVICSNTKIQEIFYSSGTTSKEKSKHYISNKQIKLYEKSLYTSFSQAFNLEENKEEIEYIILTTSLEENPNSSLIYMFDYIKKKSLSKGDYFIKNNEIEVERLTNKLIQASKDKKKCLIVGTAFSLLSYLEQTPKDLIFDLKKDSMIMETGGFKGKYREIPKQDFYALLSKKFQITEKNIIGQYGMSELGCQYYDSFDNNKRFKIFKPWFRTRILRPDDLSQEVPIGESGIIAHYDLTNIDSASFILSGDLGIKLDNNRFDLISRLPKISLKGCSLFYE